MPDRGRPYNENMPSRGRSRPVQMLFAEGDGDWPTKQEREYRLIQARSERKVRVSFAAFEQREPETEEDTDVG